MTLQWMGRAVFPPDVEDQLKDQFFGEARDGYFVDVGANDPKNMSQSWQLEQKGWRGVLVEPQPVLCGETSTQHVTARLAAGLDQRISPTQLPFDRNNPAHDHPLGIARLATMRDKIFHSIGSKPLPRTLVEGFGRIEPVAGSFGRLPMRCGGASRRS